MDEAISTRRSPRSGPGLRVALLGLLLVSPAALAGTAREFLIQNWTREHGIPGTTVTAVSQTPDG